MAADMVTISLSFWQVILFALVAALASGALAAVGALILQWLGG